MINTKKLWFRRKTYGWGWTPCSWEGWVVLAVYVFIMFGFSYINHTEAPDGNLGIGFVFPFIIFTPILIWICYKKGESPKWQWGKETPQVKVGIGVMILKDGKVLMGKRKGKHGSGEYAWPGGHLEFMESIVDCAKREVFEETGMKIKNIRFLRLLNMKNYDKHYVDIAMVSDWESGDPELKEPEKCEGWDWYDIDNLPNPIFASVQTYFEALKTGKNFFDK